ncbi:MAG: DUF1801 domain-containing protein [Ferruginibacter sp.]
MGKKIKAIDSYIAKSGDFAKPMLMYFRELMHKTCPDVEEAIKWNMPFYEYKNSTICMMGAFKEYCIIRFWKASLIKGLEKANADASGSVGRLKNLKDFPPEKKLVGYIKEAMLLNEKGVKIIRAKPVAKAEIIVPDYFKKALAKDKKAAERFEKFSPSKKEIMLIG